jgi:hypothetical protein
MSPDQFAQFMKVLEKILDKPVTITQATDWQMLVVLFGVIIMLIGLLWHDLRSQIGHFGSLMQDHKADDCKTHDNLKIEYEKSDAVIWSAIRDCQADCCPPRKRRKDDE